MDSKGWQTNKRGYLMTFLSDRDILAEMEKGHISCTPFARQNLSNSSLDLRLGDQIIHTRPDPSLLGRASFDLDETGRIKTSLVDCTNQTTTIDRYLLYPGAFILAHTLEQVGASASHIVGQISDKSTLARLGLSTFFGAGYIDPGNVLNITLEIKNNGHIPIELQAGQHICQIRFAYLNSPVLKPYNGKYQSSTQVEGAK
jgi:dCTP deaminase